VKTALRCLAALLCVNVGINATAAPTVFVDSTGYYVVERDAQNVPHLVKANVVHLDGTPPDGPAPPPDSGSQLTKNVKSWAGEIDNPAAVKALELVYAKVKEAIKDGTLAPEDAFPAVRQATDQVMKVAELGDVSRVQAFREKLSVELNKMQNDGSLSTRADYLRVFGEVEAGLSQVEGAQAALNISVILAIVTMILNIIKLFKGGGIDIPPINVV
jgi:hypothetical protein